MLAKIKTTIFSFVLVHGAFVSLLATQTSAAEGPLSPPDSINQMQLHPECEIKLVAAEPEVIDPVAIRFDANGAMWVVEMRDYPNGPANGPNGPKEGEKPKSRIKILKDKDGDGYFETASIFADHLLFANGIQPWDGGVIVTMAGEVAYLKDTDGDGVSDSKETWFRGFAEQNPQLRANHPTLSIDGWIYIANGLRGGTVECVHPTWKEGTEPISIREQDFRFHPKTGKFEAVAGNGQFGLTFDDFGNRFLCSNRNPCMHVVLENRHVKRNPNYPVARLVHDVSPAGADSKIFPISNFWTTSTLHEGTFTAACGVHIYRGDAMTASFYGNSFTCDPTGNLVHRDVLKRDGATFDSTPGRAGVEFLASKDTWFRPVNLSTGPDGGLYVVDMYRAVIEHPQFMPAELKNRPDLRLGDDKGRIYRIVAKDHKPYRKLNETRLAKLSNEKLIPLLSDSNSWQRDTAFRRLYERGEKSIADQLRQHAMTAKSAVGRANALWLAYHLNPAVITVGDLKTLMESENEYVQIATLKVAEQLEKTGVVESHQIKNSVNHVLANGTPSARFNAALISIDNNGPTLLQLGVNLLADPTDWSIAAILGAVGRYEKDAFLVNCFFASRVLAKQQNRFKEIANYGFLQKISECASLDFGTEDHVFVFLMAADHEATIIGRPEVYLHIIKGTYRGLPRHKPSIYKTIQTEPTAGSLDVIWGSVFNVKRFERANQKTQRLYIECIGLAPDKLAVPRLLELLDDQKNKALQPEIIAALSRFSDERIGDAFLEELKTALPGCQQTLIDGMLSNSRRTKLLLTELEAGHLSPRDLSLSQTTRLQRSRDADIKKRAAKILASAVPADRKEMLAKYAASIKMKANPTSGRLVFKEHCSSCHRVDGVGTNVGPDISDYCRTKSTNDLLTSILDPNRAIDANYFAYTVIMNDGKVHNGLLRSETPTSVTLKLQKGTVQTLLKTDIDTLHSTRNSLMPVGLERNISLQQMADLLAFVKNWRYLDGRVPIDVGTASPGKSP